MTHGSTPGICLVGCGWWGAIHGLELKRQGDRIRRYFVSRRADRAREFAQRFDGRAFERVEDALADPAVDAALIALPHDIHADMAERALRAGKHVLVEKPIAIDIETAERLVQVGESTGRCLAVAEEYRLSPLVRAVSDLLRENALGRLCWVRVAAAGVNRPAQAWKNRRETMGGGVLIDVGVHYIDVLRVWFGQPELVWAIYPPHLNQDFEGEDSVIATLRFSGGLVATIALSWSSHRSREAPHIELSGERGAVELRFDRPFLTRYSPLPGTHWSHRVMGVLPWRVANPLSRYFPKQHASRLHVPREDLIGTAALIDDFISAIINGTPPAVPGREGLEDLRVVLAAYEAARTGTPVTLR